jgi:hypothetical protein
MMNARVISATAVLVVAGFSGLAVSQSSQSRDGSVIARHPRQTHAMRVAHLSQALTDRFEILRAATPRTAADQVAGLRTDSASFSSQTGMLLDKARRLGTVGARGVWVIPTSTGICLMAGADYAAGEIGPGGGCFTAGTAVDGDAWQAIGNAEEGGGADLFALVPDGVPSATVTFADGTSTAVPIDNNALMLHVVKDVDSYSYVYADKTVTVPARTFRG